MHVVSLRFSCKKKWLAQKQKPSAFKNGKQLWKMVECSNSRIAADGRMHYRNRTKKLSIRPSRKRNSNWLEYTFERIALLHLLCANDCETSQLPVLAFAVTQPSHKRQIIYFFHLNKWQVFCHPIFNGMHTIWLYWDVHTQRIAAIISNQESLQTAAKCKCTRMDEASSTLLMYLAFVCRVIYIWMRAHFSCIGIQLMAVLPAQCHRSPSSVHRSTYEMPFRLLLKKKYQWK